MEDRIARGFLPTGDGDPDEKDRHHGTEDSPALAGVADRLAETPGQPDADQKDRQHLHKIGERGWIFERVRTVGVEEAATIGAEHLDRFLRCDRADRERLLDAFEGRHIDRSRQCLRHAARDEEDRVGDAKREQQIQRHARHVGPEITDRRCAAARKAAEQRKGERDARRRREEVVDGQAEHLAEVRHRRFAAIALPVGVGGETDRGVERKMLAGAVIADRASSGGSSPRDWARSPAARR